MGNMINVTIGSNTSRQTTVVPDTRTVRELFDENDIQYAGTSISIDGCPISIGDMDKSLAALGIKDKCYIIAVTKTNNA